MDIETLNALGLNAKQIESMIVERAVEALLKVNGVDQWGQEEERQSDLSTLVASMAKGRIDEKISELAQKHLLPKIDADIETVVIQETTRFGVKLGHAMTMSEYMIAKVEAYMFEPVNYNGESKDQRGIGWVHHSTRIVNAIEKILERRIEVGLVEEFKDSSSPMAMCLHEASRAAIKEVAAKFAIVTKDE